MTTPKPAWPLSPLKRCADAVFALMLLVCLWPLVVVLALGVLFSLGRPVFFVQSRPGLGGRPFRLIKFRTLAGSEAETESAEGKRPPNGFASFLRASGLDELPELLNILKGEMSLIGPRPLLMRYLERYTPEQARRHEVRPGLTGWAQVHGRNAVNWPERLDLDVWYVDHATWQTDLRILVLTLRQILSRTGTAEPGEFQGTVPCSDDGSGSPQPHPEG